MTKETTGNISDINFICVKSAYGTDCDSVSEKTEDGAD